MSHYSADLRNRNRETVSPLQHLLTELVYEGMQAHRMTVVQLAKKSGVSEYTTRGLLNGAVHGNIDSWDALLDAVRPGPSVKEVKASRERASRSSKVAKPNRGTAKNRVRK